MDVDFLFNPHYFLKVVKVRYNMETVLLKCPECGQINRVVKSKFHLHPKCHSCKKVLTYPKTPLTVTGANFNEEVVQSPGIVLLDLWSPTCGYCMKLNPILDEIASEYAGIIKVGKINTQNDQVLTGQFNIRGVPALFLYNDGKKIGEVAGFMPKNDLVSWIKSRIDL